MIKSFISKIAQIKLITKRRIYSNRILRDINGLRSCRKILLSYNIYPFVSESKGHSNAQEIRAIVTVFTELGYSVDVCHFTCNKIPKYNKYNIIFGFGNIFENSFGVDNLTRIYYATGAHVCVQNSAEMKRVYQLNQLLSVAIRPRRYVKYTWSKSTCLSDYVLILGNSWTRSTYSGLVNGKIHVVNATALFNRRSESIRRDHNVTKYHLLWFGSSGLVHKGLDLVLGAVAIKRNVTLHICGPMENDFSSAFKNLLNMDNVQYHGFVDVQSDKFIDIVATCSFVVFPTCSEGQSTSLLTSMGTGLIPITTKYSGITQTKSRILIDKLTIDSVSAAIDKGLSWSKEDFVRAEDYNRRDILEHHTVGYYQKRMSIILEEIVNEATQGRS